MDVTRRAALRAGAGALALPLVGRASAHPGPYEPYDSVTVRGATEAVVDPDGTTVYVAAGTGFAVVDASDPTDLEVVAEHRGLLTGHEHGPLDQIRDVKVAGDTLAVVGPANAGRPRALLLYDVTDPSRPVQRAVYETDYPIHNCYLTDTHAYLTVNHEDATEVAIVDVTRTPPAEVARWGAADADPAWRDVPAYLRSCHDVYVRDDTMYVAHWDAGTWLVDVTDPADPALVSHVGAYEPSELTDAPSSAVYQLPGNHHYAAPNDDGSLLAVNYEAWDQTPGDGSDDGPGGIDLFDLTDATTPVRVAHIPAPPTPDPTDSGTWTTSHNFGFAGDRLYTSWYQGGVKLFDVSDPASPEELAWWRKPDEAAFWTARKADGCFVAASTDLVPADTRTALYAFPDHPGQQANPPSLTTTRTTTSTATPTTPKPTTSPSTTTSTRTTTTTTGSTPGFGVATAVLGTAAAAYHRLRDEPKD